MALDAAGDREVELMALIVERLGGLDEGARRRVCRWFADRFGGADAPEDTRHTPEQMRKEDDVTPQGAVAQNAAGLEALYDTARTTAQWERALIAGYWLQEVKRRPDFDAMMVNQAMRSSGHRVSNITRELTKLTSAGFVAIQPDLSKGRRRFRVTREGVRWLKQRIAHTEA